MPIDLLAKFSVVEKITPEEGRELYENFLVAEESVQLSYRHRRDRVIFTDRKIIAMDIQGLTGKKKEFRIFPYSKISSFSVETAGSLDLDNDLKIWVSGVGVFGVKMGRKIDIGELGKFLSQKIT